VITQHVNQALSDNGLTRFHWQVLNTVHDAGTTTKAQVFEAVKNFVDAAGLDGIVADFVGRGWMIADEDAEDGTTALTLTPQGAVGFETIFNIQRGVRQRAMQGITPDEYQLVLAVLQRIVSNLE
jgi:DNA-binding MarR family transcriptional regulator